MTTRSQLGVYYKVAVTARYDYKGSACREDLRSALFAALATVIAQHPVLSVIPVDVDTPAAPHFVRLPLIDLGQVVTFTETDDEPDDDGRFPALDRFLEREHSQPFQYTTPLSPFWRLHVFRHSLRPQFTACFSFHHCLCDTKSALVFHEALERALNEGKGEPNVAAVSFVINPPNVPLLPPIDEFIKDRLSRARSAKEEVREQPANQWSGAVQSLPVRTRNISLWLSTDQSKRLATSSKQHGVSVTATLQAMLAAGVFRQLPPSYTVLESSCAISLRGWLPPPITADVMGVFVESFSDTFHRGDKFSWDDARRAKATIDQVVRQRRGTTIDELARVDPADLKSSQLNKMGRPRLVAWELSNVGRLLAPEDTLNKAYQIQSLLFSQSAGAASGAIKVSAVTGRDQRLNIVFTWQEGVVEDDMVAGVVKDFESILENEL